MNSGLPRFRLVLPLIAALAAAIGYTALERRLGVLEPDRVVAIDDFPEISGIAWWPERGTLIGVGDNGQITELTAEGKVLRKRFHPGRDFEDVVLLPDRRVQAVDEQHARLLTVSLDDFSIVAEQGLPAGASLTRRTNKSIEGLALTARHSVYANEYPPALVFSGAPGEAPSPPLLLGAKSLSGAIAGPRGELLLVSRENGLLLLDAAGRPAGDWRPVEYHHIEGAALVPGFGLVLCADRNPGILLVYSAIQDWDALRRAFSDCASCRSNMAVPTAGTRATANPPGPPSERPARPPEGAQATSGAAQRRTSVAPSRGEGGGRVLQ